MEHINDEHESMGAEMRRRREEREILENTVDRLRAEVDYLRERNRLLEEENSLLLEALHQLKQEVQDQIRPITYRVKCGCDD